MFFVDLEGHRSDAAGGRGARGAGRARALPQGARFLSAGGEPLAQRAGVDGPMNAPMSKVNELTALAPAYVRSIAPYQPGKPISELARELGLDEARASSSSRRTRTRSASGRARAPRSMRRSARSARYPDGNGFELKAALAEALRRGHEAIVLGNGSNDVLELVSRAFLGPERSAVCRSTPSRCIRWRRRRAARAAIVVPARQYGHDLAAMARRSTPTRACCGSPTPTIRPAASRRRARSRRFCRRCRNACWWCSTRPTTSTCRRSSSTTRSSGSGAFRTWS